MTSIFEGQPPQNEAFPYQNKAHLGFRYILVEYIYIYLWWFQVCFYVHLYLGKMIPF